MSRISLLVLLALVSMGCRSYEYQVAEPRAPAPTPIAAPGRYADTKPEEAKVAEQTGGTASALERGNVYAVAQSAGGVDLSFGAQGATTPPPAPPPSPIEVGARPAAATEMIDLEARVEVEVDNIGRAVERVRAIAIQSGGQVVNEVIEDKAQSSGAALSLRVPSAKTSQVLGELARVGKLLSRKVEARDIGREYHDAQILLRNLEATLKRYEELLAKAQAAPQILEIERELSRVRTQIDRVKGDLRWLSDRAARSTIYVTLSGLETDAEVEPEAKLHPGVRAVALIDFSQSSRTYLGGGVSLAFTRVFSLDADWLTRARGGSGVDLFIATAGSELYSDLLGGGRRKFLNPYLGIRAGYARLDTDDAFALGGVLGLELWKTDSIVLDLQTRAFGLIGVGDTTHAALEPALGLNVAY